MEYDDLRGFLGLLESKGELVHIQERVSWDVEIGAISQEAINQAISRFFGSFIPMR